MSTTYNVYRDSVLVHNVVATTDMIGGLTNGVEYGFQVAAVVDGVEGPLSAVVFATPVAEPPPPSPPPPVAIYGPGIGGDTLANTPLGHMSVSDTKSQFWRFRAEQSSALDTVTFYYIGPNSGAGYAAGTGGAWKLEVRPDDGSASHFPTASVLATQNFAPGPTSTASVTVTFTSPATLVADTLYHLVVTNIDATPESNYGSTNCWYYRVRPTGTPDGRLNPRFPDTDWAHGYYSDPSGPWITRGGFTPILDLGYANGNHQGQSYGEASLASGEQGQINGTLKMVRERFTVSGGDKIVTGVSVRLLKIAGGNDPLTVRLEDDSGTLIDSFTIPASSIAEGLSPNGADTIQGNGSNAKWVSGTFASVRTLTNGSTYRLRLSTTSGTTYWAWVNRRLSYGYSAYTAATSFPDGIAEKTTNGSTWSALGRVGPKHDLQFYFEI